MKEFKCGCKFEEDENGDLIVDKDIDNIPLDCKYTWDLFKDGNTKGVFQLESNLGRTKSKQAAPDNMEELAILSAILRPGVGDAIVKNKTLAQHYIDRKAGRDPIEYFHPVLKPILEPTLGILVFQEQAMMIAREVAGFTLQEAEALRKAIGKKIVDLMAQIKINFIDGAKKKGIVSHKEASEIFSWIEKSQKYSFNKCLCVDSVVDTPEGIKLLDEIKVGDWVLAPQDNENDHFVEVIDVIDSGTKEVYEIELDSGETLKCTLDHKIKCSDGSMRPLREIMDKGLEIMVY